MLPVEYLYEEMQLLLDHKCFYNVAVQKYDCKYNPRIKWTLIELGRRET